MQRPTTVALTALAIAVLMCPASTSAAELDEVLALSFETRGGLDKLQSIETLRMKGKTLAMGQIEAPMTIEMKRPNRFRMEFTIQGITGIQAFDGETAWMLMPFAGQTEAQEVSEDQSREMRQQADIDGPLIGWKDKGHTVELLGTEDFEGTEAYKLRVTYASGDEVFVYLDTEYALEIAHRATREIPGQEGDVKVLTTFSDYKEVEGVMMSHSMETTMNDQVMAVVTIESVEVNVDLADDHFTMPEPAEPEVTETEE